MLCTTAAGCVSDGERRERDGALGLRFEAIEQRLADLERPQAQRANPFARMRQELEALDGQMQDLEARAARAEAWALGLAHQSADAAVGPEPDSPGATERVPDAVPPPVVRDPDKARRRAALTALSEELQERYAMIQEQYADDPGAVDLHEVMIELQDWYRTRFASLMGSMEGDLDAW
jgi:hypothetical protein